MKMKLPIMTLIRFRGNWHFYIGSCDTWGRIIIWIGP